MASIEINGRPTQAEAGETLLTVIRRAGVDIPTLCHIEGLSPSGACRLCVVEVDGTLLPSCSTPISEGMKVWTHSDRVIEARRTILELLLADHQAHCFSCPRGGSCPLEAMAQELGIRSRMFASKTSQEPPLSPLSRRAVDWVDSALAIERDPNQCVLCGRCVRVCEEIQGLACLDLLRVDSSAGAQVKIGPVNEGVTADEGPSHSEAPGFAESLRLNIFARSDALTRSEQTVLADPGTSDFPFTPCVNCGQCVIACPSGALRETSHIERVREALRDDSRHVMVQFDPALAVSLGEEFGLAPGTDVSGVLCAALRCIG
ncbi:MAG: (2Fe-2S)-binding protein, partial [Thermoguttaceae bacterium]|nr:(2Fe-2S)-binding protein [Thermoguttaceae bacterium]